MNSIPLTVERCKELLKKGIFFRKSCPGLVIGWLYHKVVEVDENKKTVTMEPMDKTFCPKWNPLGRVKWRIEDISEVKKDTKRRNRKKKESESEPEQKKRKRRTSPVSTKKESKKRRRNT